LMPSVTVAAVAVIIAAAEQVDSEMTSFRE
jgi:hypothetical protein